MTTALAVLAALLGLAVFASGVAAIFTGWVWAKGWSGMEIWTGRILRRDESPIAFWLTVIVYLACPPLIAVSVVLDATR